MSLEDGAHDGSTPSEDAPTVENGVTVSYGKKTSPQSPQGYVFYFPVNSGNFSIQGIRDGPQRKIPLLKPGFDFKKNIRVEPNAMELNLYTSNN